MDITSLAIIAGLAIIVLIMPVFGTLFIAGIAGAIFIWRKAFPLGWGIAEWVTNRRNLIPFVLFLLIVIAVIIILLILTYVLIMNLAGLFYYIGLLVLLLLLLTLIVAEIIFWGGIWLAVILWIVRLSHWAYTLFRRGFWRTFRPGGPPDFQPVPVPLTNPVSVAPPSSKRNSNRGRKPLVKRRAMIPATVPRPSQGTFQTGAVKQAPVKKEASRRRPVARRRETSQTTTPPPSEMALTNVEAKRAKARAKEDAKQAKAKAKEEAKQAKAQAKEEAKQAKIQAKEDAKQAKAQAEEESRQARVQAKEDKKAQAITMSEEKSGDKEDAKKAKAEQKAQVKDQAELKEEEKEKGTPRLRRKRRLKGNKSL